MRLTVMLCTATGIGPGNMSTELTRRIHGETRRAIFGPDAKDRLERAGNDLVMSSPEDFVAFVRVEIAKWARVVKASKLRSE